MRRSMIIKFVNGGDLEEAYQELRSVFLKSTGRA